eukprot:3782564-Rhodomonas_salina.2
MQVPGVTFRDFRRYPGTEEDLLTILHTCTPVPGYPGVPGVPRYVEGAMWGLLPPGHARNTALRFSDAAKGNTASAPDGECGRAPGVRRLESQYVWLREARHPQTPIRDANPCAGSAPRSGGPPASHVTTLSPT